MALNPYNAITILSFLREYINEETTSGRYELTAIKEAVDQYELEFSRNVTHEQMEEIRQENAVNQLIGKSPQKH